MATTPRRSIYAGAAYGLFHWLDEKASDEAKAALARTMRFKDYKNEQVASALVEVFDRIYTYPPLRWRAFFRSLLYTTVVSAIFVFELYRSNDIYRPRDWEDWGQVLLGFSFNVLTDYLSLFVIRPLLAIRSGTKPVIGLALGAVSGAAIVLAVDSLRRVVLASWYVLHNIHELWPTVVVEHPYLLVYLFAVPWELKYLRMACVCSVRLVAVVCARHRDRPSIDAFVLDSRKNAVVPKRRGRSIR